MTQDLLDDEAMVTELDISHLVTEDDTPVDNFQSEKQQRLLVEPLYSSWSPGCPFIAAANVGLFYALKQDPIVPDALLSLGLEMPTDWSQKQNRSYFVWEFGKVPEVCIEIVSNQEGDELTLSRKSQRKGKTATKKELYAQLGVPYYAVFDPLEQLQKPDEMNGALLRVWALTEGRYRELQPPFWLTSAGLGLTLWEGSFEDVTQTWLRWCVYPSEGTASQQDGRVIPTGAEGRDQERQRADAERQRADTERQRAERLAERLRAMGIDPDEL